MVYSKLEEEVWWMLRSVEDFYFLQQYPIDLGKKRLYLDFYLPYDKIAIECQGIQHFKPRDFFGGIEKFRKTLLYDRMKYEYCKANGIELIYIGGSRCKKYCKLTDVEKLRKILCMKILGYIPD